MPPTLTDFKHVSDLLRYEVDPQYCREGGKIENTTGAELVLPAATHPVRYGATAGTYEVCLAGEEAQTIGFVLLTRPETINAGTLSQRKYPVLVRGPAVLTQAGFVEKDPAGADYNAAALKTAAEAIPSVIVRDELGTLIEPLNPQGAV